MGVRIEEHILKPSETSQVVDFIGELLARGQPPGDLLLQAIQRNLAKRTFRGDLRIQLSGRLCDSLAIELTGWVFVPLEPQHTIRINMNAGELLSKRLASEAQRKHDQADHHQSRPHASAAPVRVNQPRHYPVRSHSISKTEGRPKPREWGVPSERKFATCTADKPPNKHLARTIRSSAVRPPPFHVQVTVEPEKGQNSMLIWANRGGKKNGPVIRLIV